MNKKQLLITGILTYSILLILSLVFYKERTVFIDISYHLFFILKDSSLAIQNNRIGAAVTQIFPLTGAKAGLSLDAIAQLYSAGFILVYCATFLFIVLGLKNYKAAVAFLLFNILMTTHTFYWIQSELPQGMAFLFVFVAMMQNVATRDQVPFYFHPVAATLLFIVSFTHPLLLFATLFLLLFFFLSYPEKRKFIVTAFATYFIFYGIKSIFFKTTYEGQAMGGLRNIITLFPDYFTIQSNKNLLRYFLHDYYFLPALLILMAVFYIKRKEYLKLFLMGLFFTGYALLINISYQGGADQFYIENQYLILSVFVAVPFAFDYLPLVKNKLVPVTVIGMICLAGIIRIYCTHDIYTARLNWNRNLLSRTAQLPDRKLILRESDVPQSILLKTWGSSYEIWLLSTIENGLSRSVIIEEKPHEFDWLMDNNKIFITKWDKFNYDQLDKKYFHFTDTTHYVRPEKF